MVLVRSSYDMGVKVPQIEESNLIRPRGRLQRRDYLVEALHFLNQVRLHLDGSLADFFAVSADGFAPCLDLIKMLNLLFDSADRLFQSYDRMLR